MSVYLFLCLILGEGGYTDVEFQRTKAKAEIDSVQIGAIGAYHYRLNGIQGTTTGSVISQAGPRVCNIIYTNITSFNRGNFAQNVNIW